MNTITFIPDKLYICALALGFKLGFNDALNAEAYFRETKSFHQTFGCDFSKENLTDAEKHERYVKFNEFY